jgi:hypothetical protein
MFKVKSVLLTSYLGDVMGIWRAETVEGLGEISFCIGSDIFC